MGYTATSTTSTPERRTPRRRGREWSYDAPALSGTWYGIKNNTADTTANNDGWDTRSGMLEIDVPRIYQVLLRSSVIKTHSVYTTMTGFSYFYVGIGNEIGYDDSNGFPNSIPVSSKPYTGVTGTRNEQSITNDLSGGVKYIRENSTGNYWWSLSWLGRARAPIRSGTPGRQPATFRPARAPARFSRVLRSAITPNLPAGTAFNDAVRRPQEEGSTTFFWSGSATSTFHHRYQDGRPARSTPRGTTSRRRTDLPLPSSIAERPAVRHQHQRHVDEPRSLPAAGLRLGDDARSAVAFLQALDEHPGKLAAHDAGRPRTRRSSWSTVSRRPAPRAVVHSSRWSFLSLVQSYLAGGLYSTAGVSMPRACASCRAWPSPRRRRHRSAAIRRRFTSPGPRNGCAGMG